jgi:hypothetical protein
MTPSTASSTATGDARRITLHLLDELFSGAGSQQTGFRLWDGTPWPDAGPRPATVVLQHPGALRTMLLSGNELGLAEAYPYDDFDLEGDIESVLDHDVSNGFTHGRLNVYQTLLVKPDENGGSGLPLTREDWYA